MWLGGGMLSIWIISLIFYRYTFFLLSPLDLGPPYWINMGAVAISTLAGALLVTAAPASPLLTSLLPSLKGLALLFWSTATWWIPMLVILGIWRHVYRRAPFTYDPLYWGAVFPLGMYTVCTIRLSEALGMPLLMTIGPHVRLRRAARVADRSGALGECHRVPVARLTRLAAAELSEVTSEYRSDASRSSRASSRGSSRYSARFQD